jgi:hypothetical protein
MHLHCGDVAQSLKDGPPVMNDASHTIVTLAVSLLLVDAFLAAV